MADILLIEDMLVVQHAIASMLKRAGHKVTVAGTGSAGLDQLRQARFDVIITDMLMPGLDGTEVILQVKAMPGAPRVIAISGGGAGVSAEAALKMAREKADAFLTKPFEKEELLSAVDRLMAKAG